MLEELVEERENLLSRSSSQKMSAPWTAFVNNNLQQNTKGIFLNVVSGVSLMETAGDQAIAAAICSSFLEFPIPNGIAFIAEVGLGGELRTVPQLEKRVNTVAKLGYKNCIVPKSAEKSFSDLQPQGMEILGCKNLKEMINTVFIRG